MKVVVIAGPTGSGKSDLAARLAVAARGEIVNYDSVQLYRGFDIGSAKPALATRDKVPHHLFDILDADQQFNAADFARLARETCEAIARRERLPILVGGTFFYLRALLAGLPEMPGRNDAIRARIRRVAASRRGQRRLHGWLSRVDPLSGSRIAPADRHRVERALEVWLTAGRPISEWEKRGPEPGTGIDPLLIALRIDRPTLVTRLDARVEEMYRNGLVEETRALLSRFGREPGPFQAIGYREAAAVVTHDVDLATAIAETKRRTRAYAKRQMTWLRSERNVHWLDAVDDNEIPTAALRLVERFTVD